MMLGIVGGLSLFAAVQFVECPKCEKRIRISDDGATAFVNLSRIDASEREAMSVRAERLLARGRPVAFANPDTPLMGWSSWNTFACNVSEDILVGIARTMATNGLKAAGYAYVNLDDGFFWGHDEDNRLRFHPERFPNGLKGTVDGIHALGMKAGIYSDAGTNTCGAGWNGETGGVNGGLYGRDREDCRLHFGELGFDFFKVDYCGALDQHLDERRRYVEIAEAIRATGRTDVRYNVCRWAFPGTWAAEIAGSWRTTRDIRANWQSVRGIIAENLYLSAYARPGHFNDLDMLEVGQYKGKLKSAFGGQGDTGLTEDEETAHFGMWCILSSPLVLGNDIRVIPETTLRLVTNPYLLHMNQDPLGLQAYVVARVGEQYVLAKDAETRFGTARYVALYNASDKDEDICLEARALDLGGRIDVFDLVQRADLGMFEGEMTVRVAAHSARFCLLDAETRLDRTVYEAETAYLTDYSELDGTPYGSEESSRLQGRAYWTAQALASGGVVVKNLGGRASNDLLWKDVKVSEGGLKRLTFRCASTKTCSFFVEIDGGAPIELNMADTGGSFAPVCCEVEVAAGVHSVRLSNSWAPMPDVDRMDLESAGHLAARARDAHAEAYAVFAADCTAKGQDAAGRFLLGEASSMEKVLPRGRNAPRALDPGKGLSLGLARHEKESVQLLVAPRAGDLRRVSVRPRGFAGFPLAAIECRVTGYVHTSLPPPYEVFDGTNAVCRVPEVGWWPDPILDYLSATDVRGQDIQSFWIRVRCPEDQKPGVYRGTLEVCAADEKPVSVPFSIRVYDFAVPQRAPYPQVCTFSPSPNYQFENEATLSRARRLARDPLAPCNVWKRQELAWGDFLADYYITMDNLYHRGDATNGVPHFGVLQRLKEQGRLGWFNLGYWNEPSELTEAAKTAWREETLGRIAGCYAKAKELGLQDHAYIYGCDEAAQEKFDRINWAIDELRKAFPGVPLFTTAYDRDLGVGSALAQIDWFAPLTTEYRIGKAEASRKDGHRVWWYICCNPHGPYANMFVECPAIEGRVLMGMQAVKYRPDGFLYYELTLWNSERPISTDDAFTDWEARSWTKLNGDGSWTCCGPDGLPLATQRLENYRDGLEDYAYAMELERRTKACPGHRVEARAKELLAVHDVRAMDDFTRDPKAVLAWRCALAEAIEAYAPQGKDGK